MRSCLNEDAEQQSHKGKIKVYDKSLVSLSYVKHFYLLCHSRNRGSGSVATTEHLLKSSPSCQASGPPA